MELYFSRYKHNKMLSCRRETAWRFVSLNMSLSHLRSFKPSRSFEMTLLSKARVSPYVPISIPLKVRLYLVPFLRYSASNNGVTLKSTVRVVQGRWIWRRSIDHSWTYYWSAIVSIAVSCTIFELFDVK